MLFINFEVSILLTWSDSYVTTNSVKKSKFAIADKTFLPIRLISIATTAAKIRLQKNNSLD